jgi:hypothetical protein
VTRVTGLHLTFNNLFLLMKNKTARQAARRKACGA